METLDDMQGPRISFSQDNDIQENTVPEKRKREHIAEDGGEAEEVEGHNNEDDGFSFEFSSAISLDLPPGYKMVSAEELFFNGKLRPLFRNSASVDTSEEETPDLGSILLPFHKHGELSKIPGGSSGMEVERIAHDVEKPGMPEFRVEHNLPMVKTSLHESLAMAKQHLRSLHDSPRCLSMTIEGSRGHPRRSCVSLNSSRCSSPSRSHPSGTFSQPRTTPTSPKASSHKSRRFMTLFKLGKSSNKDSLPSEGMASSKRSFWPFSRSNSAGESKSSHGVFPLPRRSNSAGESKTTSSALLPNSAIRFNGERKGRPPDVTATALVASAKKLQAVHGNHQQADRKGLPPLPSPNVRKGSSCLAPPNCGADSLALSQTQAISASMFKASLTTTFSSALTPTTSSLSLSTPITSYSPNVSSSSSLPCPSCVASSSSSSLPTTSLTSLSESPIVSNAPDGQVKKETLTSADSPASTVRETTVTASPAMHVRHVSASIPGRHIGRGSPAQQWSNPNMGSSMRHNIERYGNTVRGGLVRQKDVLSRDTASIRVTPILNVPSCITPSSKSKIFNLGNLFTKKEKAAKGYTMLVSTDSQDGG